jgi:NhaP-type Na+/H+ and K+/H+ antiporter
MRSMCSGYLVTLLFQGLTLPWVIRKLKIEDKYSPIPERKQELIIQKKIAQASFNYLEEKYGDGEMQNEHLHNLRSRLEIELNFFRQDIEGLNPEGDNSFWKFLQIYLELLEEQRKLLYQMNRRAEFDEELIRKYLSLIDLEEHKIREKAVGSKL